MSECQWLAGWHQLSRRQMPKPVTRPSTQVFHPIYLSLLPMTRHVEMDTETQLHIDSGSCNSQATRGLSSASSFHFLYVRERETAQDWAGDNMSRQKSIYCSQPLTLSKRIILGDSKCLLWQQGPRAVKGKRPKQTRTRSSFDFGWFTCRPSNFLLTDVNRKIWGSSKYRQSFTPKCTKQPHTPHTVVPILTFSPQTTSTSTSTSLQN